MHADQISLCLALQDLGINAELIPTALNFPTHLEPRDYYDIAEVPRVLHYHSNIDACGFLNPIQNTSVDQQIGYVNEIIRSRRRNQLDNRVFWDFRYAAFPELGSGAGSRGAELSRKCAILNEALSHQGEARLLDIGCGDLEVTKHLVIKAYKGIDISAEAVRICRAKRPDWDFAVGHPLLLDIQPAEIVLCLDVLIHMPDIESYRRMVRRLIELTSNVLIVGAYNQPPWLTSDITFYYEPITKSLREGGMTTFEILGGYRDTTVIRAFK